ncbi:MAG TPA: pyridoxal-dependent decarboxylase, partial [Thermoanaerobaculia bacterium]
MSDALLDEPLLARAHRHAVDFLRGLPERFVGAPASRDELRAALAVPLTAGGEAGETILDALVAQSHRGVIANAGPRYFGFVIGGSLPPALAADWLVSTWDQNPGLFATSPITSVVEEIAAEWLLDLFDLPRQSGVGFVTGCQMANFTGIAAGRHAVLRDAGWNVEENGLAGAPRVNVVTSAESHVTIDVALRFLGFGTKNVHRVAS